MPRQLDRTVSVESPSLSAIDWSEAPSRARSTRLFGRREPSRVRRIEHLRRHAHRSRRQFRAGQAQHARPARGARNPCRRAPRSRGAAVASRAQVVRDPSSTPRSRSPAAGSRRRSARTPAARACAARSLGPFQSYCRAASGRRRAAARRACSRADLVEREQRPLVVESRPSTAPTNDGAGSAR